MSHWREAPRPNQHTVTHSEPIANPHHRHHHSQGFSSQQYPQQHQHQHHHSSSSYTGKKNFAAIDWKTETEITVTLEPIHQAMGLIRSAVGSRKMSHLQPSTACAISAIRSLLLATDCLSRESELLTRFPVLAKIRKTILANLAELVALARSASQPYTPQLGEPQGDGLEEFKEAELEGMLKSSEETLENVRVFLKALVKCGIDLPERKDASEGLRGESGGGLIPAGGTLQQQQQQHARGNSSPGDTVGNGRSRQSSVNSLGMTRSDQERRMALQAKSMGNLKINTRGLRPGSTDQSRDPRFHQQQSSSPVSARFDVPVEEVSAGSGSDFKRGRSRLGPDAGSISSVSSVGSSNDYHPTVHRRAVSNELRQPALETVDIVVGIGMTFDSLLSVAAALIGHVQCHTAASHPSSVALLVDLSRETIDKIRDLLAIVELVIGHKPTARNHGREIVALVQAKDQMYQTTSALVEAADRVASTPHTDIPSEEDDLNKERLLSSASIIMRPARECVRLVKICGNRREAMETLGLGIRIDTNGTDQGRFEANGKAEDERDDKGSRRDSSKRSSHASSMSSASRQSREESSGSESGAGHSSLLEAYVQDYSGPRSAPLDRAYRVPLDDEQEIMMTPAEQAARNRPQVSLLTWVIGSSRLISRVLHHSGHLLHRYTPRLCYKLLQTLAVTTRWQRLLDPVEGVEHRASRRPAIHHV
jgi:son of sevenless-like protein